MRLVLGLVFCVLGCDMYDPEAEEPLPDERLEGLEEVLADAYYPTGEGYVLDVALDPELVELQLDGLEGLTFIDETWALYGDDDMSTERYEYSLERGDEGWVAVRRVLFEIDESWYVHDEEYRDLDLDQHSTVLDAALLMSAQLTEVPPYCGADELLCDYSFWMMTSCGFRFEESLEMRLLGQSYSFEAVSGRSSESQLGLIPGERAYELLQPMFECLFDDRPCPTG